MPKMCFGRRQTFVIRFSTVSKGLNVLDNSVGYRQPAEKS